MHWLLILRVVATVLSICVALLLISLFIRRRVLSGTGGVFDCGMRSWRDGHPTGWAMGMARYVGDEIWWFKVFSLLPGPALRMPRAEIAITGQRAINDVEAAELFYDHLVVELAPNAHQVRRELSMTMESAWGLRSWVEAAPPGGATYDELAV